MTNPILYRVTTGSLSEATKYSYQRYINKFLAHFKITDIDIVREWSLKLARQHLTNYVVYLRDVKEFPRTSIKIQIEAVKFFFYMIRDDDTRIDMTKVRMELPPDERGTRRDRPYTDKEIQKIFSTCARTREEVMVLLLTSTGMRLGGLHELKYGDLTPNDTPKGKVYMITVYPLSSKPYLTPCSPECAEAIDKYLNERRDDGEIINSESPLLRNLYNSLNVKKVKPITEDNVKYLFTRIIKLSGIKKGFQFKGEAKRALGFRKRYKTKAEQSGMK
jgi:site-specific recombinase XerD